MTVGIPRLTRFNVVRIEDSICSPMQTTAISQFWIDVYKRQLLQW